MSSELIEKSKSAYGQLAISHCGRRADMGKWTKCHVDSTISKPPYKPAILRTNRTLRNDGPVFDGLEVMKRVRAAGVDAGVVFLSPCFLILIIHLERNLARDSGLES